MPNLISMPTDKLGRSTPGKGRQHIETSVLWVQT